MKTSILNNLTQELWDISSDYVPGTWYEFEREEFKRKARKLIRKAIRDDLKGEAGRA